MNIEQLRVEAVERFMVLDEGVKKDLNDIVGLVAQLCDVPIAIISLIDEDMQWFKASKGVEIHCNTREASFCQFTIQQNNLLMVENMQADERFLNHPYVTGEPHIKFYAGANLTTREGHHAGTLCILDVKTKKLTGAQQNAIRILARQVMNLMELSHSFQSLDEQHKEVLAQKEISDASQLHLKAIFDSSKDIFLLVGSHLEILAFNNAAAAHMLKVTGIPVTIGSFLSDYAESSVLKKLVRFYSAALVGHKVRSEFNIRVGTPHAAWMEITFTPISNAGKILGVALNACDITARKRHEEQINLQNDALQRIAIIQSHELRRPVASLMGMIELIKLEQAHPYEDYAYFKLIEKTVNELDTKICGIVSDSETTLNSSVIIN